MWSIPLPSKPANKGTTCRKTPLLLKAKCLKLNKNHAVKIISKLKIVRQQSQSFHVHHRTRTVLLDVLLTISCGILFRAEIVNPLHFMSTYGPQHRFAEVASYKSTPWNPNNSTIGQPIQHLRARDRSASKANKQAIPKWKKKKMKLEG